VRETAALLKPLFARSATLIPQAALGHLGWLRGAVGAGLGIALSAAIGALVLGGISPALPMIVAPMGASAVLVFALPASPLAQPWSVIGGSVLSALAGIAIGSALGSPLVAGALAVATAIALMSLTRCLHPPGGACALICALGATGPENWGAIYLLAFTVNALVLALAGWLYNNLTGHSWPHHVDVPAPRPAIAERLASREDVEAVLEDWDELIDIDVDDLHALVQAVERRREGI
jgi:CBS domain-containing membrane protein